jgi:hypothetical protein
MISALMQDLIDFKPKYHDISDSSASFNRILQFVFCFQMAVELKQGVSQLELLYEQITKEELAKQQKKEHKKQKRRKKKEKRAEQDEKENNFEVCFVCRKDCVVSA